VPESHPESQPSKPPRRSQEQRRADTRRRILDATVQCLHDYGYGGTTTVRVVERAGVTRGALAHHFASKADMVAAAVGHIAASRAADVIPKLDHAQLSDDPIDAGLDLLWAVHQGNIFVAVVELWVAARTDPELQRRVALLEQASMSVVVEFAKILFGERVNDPAVLSAIYTAMDAARGILLMKIAMPESSSKPEAQWRRAKADLRILFEHVLSHEPVQAT
jgi:AcrR family transcriptional regulator